MRTAWCPECRGLREVEDVHAEGHYETGREVAYTVVDLGCGHTVQGDPVDVGPAPGAPYAGPDRVVAATHHPADLRAARAREAAITADPWEDQ